MKTILISLVLWGFGFTILHAQSYELEFYDASSGEGISETMVYSPEMDTIMYSNSQGWLKIKTDRFPINITCIKEGYQTRDVILYQADTLYRISMEELRIELEEVRITQRYESDFSSTKMQNVDGFGIYAAKKSELINLDKLLVNKSVNNAREVYSSIPGLNIWENDGSGLQLNIGARGLNPNRSANFNTRQNGYDISADALGYPESYYTPPLQAVENIQMVRGAASLQFGPQFGGLLNFKLKEGPQYRKLEFYSENTAGSFGLLNTYNSIGGQLGKINYYGFFSYKQGDSWRKNGEFDQRNGYGMVRWDISNKWKVTLEQTIMNYLAKQPGGMVDFQFEENPRQSLRERNWFTVKWQLSALTTDYKFSDRTAYNGRFFFLNAGRKSLGVRGPINRPDPGRERELVDGIYQNFGHESRLIHRYKTGKRFSTLLTGFRIYRGYSQSKQGFANDGKEATFHFLHPDDLETAAYEFPSWNAAVFTENLFIINKNWTVTPGIRYEYIRTSMEGYYKQRVLSGDEVIVNKRFDEEKNNNRSFILIGLGISRKLDKETEAYFNFSQNYRSINFTDLAVINPNLKVDKNMEDERGYNADMGLRGYLWNQMLRFDWSAFYLRYNNRIGLTHYTDNDPIWGNRLVTYRTNVGNARIWGVESYLEADLRKIFQIDLNNFRWHGFVNASVLEGRYTSGGTDVAGNEIENVPPFNLKTGIQLSWDKWQFKYQYSFTRQHFSDATNSLRVADATRGIIPSYSVMDVSMSYRPKMFTFQTGINNLLDQHYFTRRALSYPGPGIIPAPGRSVYFTVGITL